MVEIQTFLFGLLIASTATGLVTQGIKTMFNELKIKYHANTLAGVVSVFISAIVSVCYIICNSLSFTPPMVVSMIALIITTWLSSMVGYDKVVQTIMQIKVAKKGEQDE